MGSDLIPLVVALSLGTAVVVLGLRRNLDDVTRNGLPRFEEAPETATPTPEQSVGEPRGRELSPGQRWFLVGMYLLLSVSDAVSAVLSAENRPMHVVGAALFGISAAVFALRSSKSTDLAKSS